MKILKRLSAAFFTITVLFACCVSSCFAEESFFDTSAQGDGIKDTDGVVSIKGKLALDEGTPVTIIVATRITDSSTGADITAEKIKASETIQEFLSVVEYTETFTLPEKGSVDRSFNLKDDMETEFANVYISYAGGTELIKIGEFEHVGRNDVNFLMQNFNKKDYSTYPKTISDDIEGIEILRKTGADIIDYTNIVSKIDFAKILSEFKPAGGFTPTTLIEKFNESIAWMKLRENQNTLSVLSDYNSVYWNVEIGETSDFASVSDSEKEKIVSAIKAGNHISSETLENAFSENTVLAMTRELKDRNSLTELFEKAKYAEMFKTIKALLNNSGLNEYQLIKVYDYVLNENSALESFTELENLISRAIEAVKSDKKKPSSGGGGGGGGGSASKPVLQIPAVAAPETPVIPSSDAHPFKDVSSEHWASTYITNMYKSGIISGKAKDTFAPDEKINRQDFVKLVISALEIDLTKEESSFNDVEKGGYYEPYIMTAVKKGIITGTSEAVFGMSEVIKREDVAVILSRIIDANSEKNVYEKTFADESSVSEYAKEAVNYVSECGIFKGDDIGNFNPKNGLSRAEAAALISRMITFLNK